MVLKYDEHTSSIRKTGKLDVTDRISDIGKFGAEERGTKWVENTNRRGPNILKNVRYQNSFTYQRIG